MRTTHCVTVIATAIGLALTTGCGAGSVTGAAGAPSATTATGTATAGRGNPSGSGTATGSAGTATTGPSKTQGSPSSGTGTGSEPVLAPTGLAGVPLGADADTLAAALGGRLGKLSATDRQTLAEYQCVYRKVSGAPGLLLRVTGADPEGSVQVISLTEGSRIATSTGISLGDSLTEVQRVYEGNILDQPIDFMPEGGHAVVALASGGARWVFITDQRNKLVEIRLGNTPDVFAPEGCV